MLLFLKKNKLSIVIIAILVIVQIIQIKLHYIPGYIHADTKHVYLPAAKDLLEQGFHYFSTEKSIEVSPFRYIYFIPFLDHLRILQAIHALFGIFSLFFIYQITRLISNNKVAIFALAIYVLTPRQADYWPTLLTEPLFMFLTLICIYSVISLYFNDKKSYLIIAIITLVLSLMTRPVHLYFLYFFVIFFPIIWILVKDQTTRNWLKKVLLIAIIALICVWIYSFKNYLQFGVFNLSTGTPAALYLGIHPFTGGVLPSFNGSRFDIGVVSGSSHLSIQGSQNIMLAAKQLLSELGLKGYLELFCRKFYLVFLDHEHPESRYIRLAALPFFVYILLSTKRLYRQSPSFITALFLALFLAYNFAILLPALTISRYTVVGVAALTAIVFAYIYSKTFEISSKKTNLFLHISAAVLIYLGYADIHAYQNNYPKLNQDHYIKSDLLSINHIDNQKDQGFMIEQNKIKVLNSNQRVPITWQINSNQFSIINALMMIHFDVVKGSCTARRSKLKTFKDNNPSYSRHFKLKPGTNDIRFGFFAQTERMKQLTIQLSLRCDQGSEILFKGIDGYYDTTAYHLVKQVRPNSSAVPFLQKKIKAFR